jgi:DNA polymerase
MPKPTRDLHLDFETYCDLDLRKVGIHQYVNHASFRVLAVAWKLDGQTTRKTYLAQYAPPQWVPHDLWQALQNPDVQGHAWNAAFETAVLARCGVFCANLLSCTMQRALAYGLPGRLETAAAALGTARQKNMVGHRLMLKMTKPLKPGAPNWTPADQVALADYCADDVEAEAAIAAVIPELPADEAELSRLDALMNTGGALGIDHSRVVTLGLAAKAAEKVDAARCAVLTGRAVTSPGTQTARLLAWLAGKGFDLVDTTRATIEETLALFPSAPVGDVLDVREVLQIRLRMARASTRKLERMLDMSAASNRALRGQFQFCGAGRTGRWSGRGVQVQNLPRVPKGFDPDLFAATARAGAQGPAGALDAVAAHPVLDCVSWSLRSCLKATDDAMVLWSFDFSQIEARVLAWLAGQRDILAVFAAGEDVYTWAASQFGSGDRQLGKVLVLALGFGMGATKLRETALKSYGVKLTASQAEKFKDLWRQSNRHIVEFWTLADFSAKQAVLNRGTVQAVGGSGIAFQCTPKTLQMRLPSGRVLYYHKPRLDQATGALIYWGSEVGGRWVEQRTWGGKLAENCLAAGTRVLTDRGWTSIEKVTTRDMVWDGVEWVSHAGLISSQGEQGCLNFHGVWMTPDHKVLTDDGWRAAGTRPKPAREGIRVPDGAGDGGDERGSKSPTMAMPVSLRGDGDPGGPRSDRHGGAGAYAVLRRLQETTDGAHAAGPWHVTASGVQGVVLDAVALSRHAPKGLEKLRRARDTRMSGMGSLVRVLLGGGPARLERGARTGPDRQQQGLRARQHPVGDAHGERSQPAHDAPGIHAGLVGTDRHQPAHALHPLVSRPVYDLRNAGSRSRFMVMGDTGPFIVSNCTQAVARDIMSEAMLRAFRRIGVVPCMTVHDELVYPVKPEQVSRRAMEALMLEPPPWAGGLPLAGENKLMRRYGVVDKTL